MRPQGEVKKMKFGIFAPMDDSVPQDRHFLNPLSLVEEYDRHGF
jgi:hypothetical protein